MIEKEIAINILEDIKYYIDNKNYKGAEKTTEYYIKNILIMENAELQNLMKKYAKSRDIHGNKTIRTTKIEKKIDKIMSKIYNQKI